MYKQPTAFLIDLDSHGIYDAKMLDECEFDTSGVLTHTPEEIVGMIKARGLGGQLIADPAERLFNGWQAAEALARRFAPDDDRWRHYQGRGSIFRACFAALESAGQ
jgi:hypothetical protein